MQPRFSFENVDVAERYTMLALGKKWRENRLNLYNKYVDETLTREANIKNVPDSVPLDQWSSYYDIRQQPRRKVILINS